MTVIYGRSQTEIDDDAVTTCHTKMWRVPESVDFCGRLQWLLAHW